MGGTTYSSVDHAARSAYRVKHDIPVFSYHADIKSGKKTAKVHESLDPKGLKIREARDSDAHPVTVPIAVIMDTTGSMGEVPGILEERLSKLMGTFLEDKASGKKYLGEGYPSILIGAVDDYDAQNLYGGNGALQFGQFESGMEIDQMLENLWLTANGGGTYSESYELALYALAHHTAHDHWDKRGRKGYAFIIGDEHAYPQVSAKQVRDIIGDNNQSDISLNDVIAKVQEFYHLFFIIPAMTNHYHDKSLSDYWMKLLGQQNLLKLEDPKKIQRRYAR